MFKNYLKIALRNIKRHFGYSFINIAGLAIGMVCCLLITLWVIDELSYDKFHENAADLYRVEENQYYSAGKYHVNVTPYPLAPALVEEIPEIIDATRWVGTGTVLLRYGDLAYYETGLKAVDPSFFKMFSFPFVKGDPNTALNNPNSVVISEEIAEKYFPDEDPIGKALNAFNRLDFTVTGVMKNIPRNSYLRPDMVIPYEYLKQAGFTNKSFGSNSIRTFVQLQPNASVEHVNENIKGFIKSRVEGSVTELEIAPYTKIHLRAYWGYGKDIGQIKYVYIFSVIALFVLIIACINFMNLSTARSASRAKEVGLRKVVGALRVNIIRQFYGESVFYAIIALIMSLGLVVLLLGPFNTLSGKELSLNFTSDWMILLCMVGITLFTGFVSGSYPALFLSAFQPVKVLKGSLKTGVGSSLFRRILVVTQFALSIFLIIGTLIVYKQINFMKSKSVGYDKEHIVYLSLRGEINKSYDTFKNELLKNPQILGVTGSSHRPSGIGSNSSGANWDGKDPEQIVLIGMSSVDFDYTETLKIDLKEGRSFSKEYSTDKTEAFLVNEEVAKLMGKESVVGENFSFAGKKGKIIGVMKNFHYSSVRQKIEPLAVYINPSTRFSYALIRISPGNISDSISNIEKTWQEILPNYPFEYRFLDEDFERMYRTEERMGTLLKYFSVLAIFIACLGLFGLASYTAEQKTKEIGIRKVLGASVRQIVYLLCKEFFILVLLANLISWPVAYFVMQGWQKGFAYKAGLGVVSFGLALVLALAIAILTVSFQAIKAAIANPVNALKYE